MSETGASPATKINGTTSEKVVTSEPTSTGIKETLENKNGIAAALARALTRSVAIYFSRPVRLFRPAKVSGWTSLRGTASRDGASLTPSYILELIRSQGFLILPRHFIPPLIVNTFLGTVLWESYSLSLEYLEKQIPNHPLLTAASSGAFAGACQSLMAAPAENVRIVLESARHTDPVKELLSKPTNVPNGHSGWGHAVKRVFQGDEPLAHAQTREEVRQLQRWAQEVRGMAGRGWDGWAWGCSKDVCGFALFFSIFELSRKVATDVAYLSVEELERLRMMLPNARSPSDRTRTTTARVAQGVTLVGGGVVAGLAYEVASRPFDNARKMVYLYDQHRKGEQFSKGTTQGGSMGAKTSSKAKSRTRIVTRLVLEKIKSDGLQSFFVDPQKVLHAPDTSSPGISRSLNALLRTLGRVGPWGVGFLLYESLGGQLAQV